MQKFMVRLNSFLKNWGSSRLFLKLKIIIIKFNVIFIIPVQRDFGHETYYAGQRMSDI